MVIRKQNYPDNPVNPVKINEVSYKREPLAKKTASLINKET